MEIFRHATIQQEFVQFREIGAGRRVREFRKVISIHNSKLFRALLLVMSANIFSFIFSAQSANAQMGIDQLGTFLPIGHREESTSNEHLARTLKNEQELKFRTRVLARRGIVLVEFSLSTCPACDPCAKYIISQLPKFAGKVDYIRLDLNKNLGLSYKYDVPEVPAVLIFRDGQLEDKFVAFKPEQRSMLSQSIERIVNETYGVPQPDSRLVLSKPRQPVQ